MTDDERAIRELVNTWFEASHSGDLQTVLDLMTEDAIFLVPGAEPFGKEVFAAAFKDMKGVLIEGRSDIKEIEIVGDWAYFLSHIDMTATPPGGTPTQRSGYALTIMRKGPDGRWRLARDANLLTATGV